MLKVVKLEPRPKVKSEVFDWQQVGLFRETKLSIPEFIGYTVLILMIFAALNWILGL